MLLNEPWCSLFAVRMWSDWQAVHSKTQPMSDANVFTWFVWLHFGSFYQLINRFEPEQTVLREKEPKRLQNATVLCLLSGLNEANYRHPKCPDVLDHMTCRQSFNLLSAVLLQYAVTIISGCHVSSFSIFRQINFLIGNIRVLLSLRHHFILLWGIVAESVHDDENILLHFFSTNWERANIFGRNIFSAGQPVLYLTRVKCSVPDVESSTTAA